MSGQDSLGKLLATMRPQLHDQEFVFCSVPKQRHEQPKLYIEPVCRFREEEGVTLIVEREAAERAGLECDFVARMVTLSVHSSLEAVGFLAVITTRLAAAGISVNPVSAYYHDHLFVPVDRAQEVMELLGELTVSASTSPRRRSR
jgi:hypothetical protein